MVKLFQNHKKVCLAIAFGLIVLLLALVPYLRVDFLTSRYGWEFSETMLPGYSVGAGLIDCKVYSYAGGQADVMLVYESAYESADGDHVRTAVMATLVKDTETDTWSLQGQRCLWTTGNGDRKELCWPMFYWKEFVTGHS